MVIVIYTDILCSVFTLVGGGGGGGGGGGV